MASSLWSCHSDHASSSRSLKYDVFISFRGKDIRKTFVDHLYSGLVLRLVRTYKDDEELNRGDSIRPSLQTAIEESRIAVIVLSKNYADSSWCLDELEDIMKCKDEKGLIVVPIFYDIDPSQVRKQEGDFGEAFSKLEEKNATKVESWRKVLVDVSNIAGWEPKIIADGHESVAITEIVDSITEKLFSFNSDVDEELVGMKERLQDLISRLEIGSGGVRMIGIWGIGGSGKTTLASAVYAEISRHFQSHCTVANIREESRKHGLTTLQEKLLYTFFKAKPGVQSVEEGKRKLKSRLCYSNVLILLDDVDDLDQLHALAGSHKWFGDGSRIMITTRDEHLLTAHRVDHVSPIRLLSKDEATGLFYKHAYNEKKPLVDYETLSLRVVSYAAGLPSALKVLGSFLFDKDESEWISALAMLKDIPNIKVMDILRISYDGLETYQKELFLDIACFFRGKSTWAHHAIEILEACGLHPVIGIRVLRQKALITIVDGRFDMHDLVQEMGHYIVRGEHPNNPEKHSRVWKKSELDNMCYGDSTEVNHKIEAIEYNGPLSHLCKLITNMKKLRWLNVYDFDNDCDTDFLSNASDDDDDNYDVDNHDDDDDDNDYDDEDEDEDEDKDDDKDEDEDEDDYEDEDDNDDGTYVEVPSFLSNELRYFYWRGYPASPFSDSFQLLKLVVLNMNGSLQKVLWHGYKCLPQLKVLELKHMTNLLSTPDFDGLPCLQRLKLMYCDKLEENHPSLGNHRSLEYISVSCCQKLTVFPTIVRMEKLNTLEIENCYNILQSLEIQSNMKSLVKLSLCKNWRYFHPTITILRYTQLKTMFYQSKHRLRRFRGWFLKDGEIPSDIRELSNLVELELSDKSFSLLDSNLLQLTRLKLLRLSNCKRLVELPELPSSVSILEADGCNSLTTIGKFRTNCKCLCQVSVAEGGNIIDGGRLLQSMIQGRASDTRCMVLKVEGLEIPKRFFPRLVRGNTCMLRLPENWCIDFCGFILCAVWKNDFGKVNMITMMQAMGMDSQPDHEVVWEESVGDRLTWAVFVSFDSLKHTSWWDQTYTALSFSSENYLCSGFGAGLVPRKNPTALPLGETSTNSSKFSKYRPSIKIVDDSASELTISFESFAK